MFNDYETFKKEVFNLTSIDLDKYKERQMKRRIDALIAKHHIKTYYDYVVCLKTDKVMFEEFVNYLTINVSEFFRNPEQWSILEKEILPEISKNYTKKINIWSAACSTGEEPYSLAMMLLEHTNSTNFNIIATDIDKKVLSKASSGVYNRKQVYGIESKYMNKYIKKTSDDTYEIDNKVKECISFKQHNLLKDVYPAGMDLIICRNVLIYFTEEAKETIYSKFHNSLNNGCVLFVGSTEQIIRSNQIGFQPVKSFFYKKM